MSCQRCKSDRVLSLGAKCSDCCNYSIKGAEGDGYVPRIEGIGGGDYIDVNICLDCGQVQGKFPVAELEIEETEELDGDCDPATVSKR